MAQYINKDTLVAEIERQQRKLCVLSHYGAGLRKDAAIKNGVYCYLLSFLDTLEVKELDNDCTKLDRHDATSTLVGGSFPDAAISVVDYNGEKWVRVQALGEDFVIAAKDLDDGAKFTYNSAMERLKDLGLDTFNRKQGELIEKYIDQINTKLREIGGDPMDKYDYVSNELCNDDGSVGEYAANSTWYFSGYDMSLDSCIHSYSIFRCRPCSAYSETNKESNPDATISVVEHNSEKWVRVQALGEDFVIAPRDLDDNKEFTYNEAMARLKELGLDTFNKKQGHLIAIYIDQINDKLSEIGGGPMDKYAYVSNELCKADGSVGESYADYTWYFNGYSRTLADNRRFSSYFRCRPCIPYSILKR